LMIMVIAGVVHLSIRRQEAEEGIFMYIMSYGAETSLALSRDVPC